MNSQHRLNLDEIMDVASQAVSLGLHTIGISGGEPLLHPEVKSIIPLLSEKLNVRLYTTGITLDAGGKVTNFDEWSLFDTTRTTIIFNVQSTDPRVHDSLTGRRGSLELTMTAMLSAKRSGYNVEVHMVPNLLNLLTLESSVSDLANWGVDQISFLRLVPQGNAARNSSRLVLAGEDSRKLKSILHRLSLIKLPATKLRFGIPLSEPANGSVKCNAAANKLIIRYDGVVLPCEAFKCAPGNLFELGDIRSRSLHDLLLAGQSLLALNTLKRALNDTEETCPAQVYWARLGSLDSLVA